MKMDEVRRQLKTTEWPLFLRAQGKEILASRKLARACFIFVFFCSLTTSYSVSADEPVGEIRRLKGVLACFSPDGRQILTGGTPTKACDFRTWKTAEKCAASLGTRNIFGLWQSRRTAAAPYPAAAAEVIPHSSRIHSPHIPFGIFAVAHVVS